MPHDYGFDYCDLGFYCNLTIWTFRRADLQISIPRGNCYLFPINYGYKYEQLSQG